LVETPERFSLPIDKIIRYNEKRNANGLINAGVLWLIKLWKAAGSTGDRPYLQS
jgi:hypothetical protein